MLWDCAQNAKLTFQNTGNTRVIKARVTTITTRGHLLKLRGRGLCYYWFGTTAIAFVDQ